MSKPELIFWEAIKRDDVKLVKYLIQGYDIDVNIKDGRDRNLFCYADSKEMIELFKSLGLDINEQDKRGKTALHYSPDMKKAKLLIECGADPSIEDNVGQCYHEIIRRRIKKARSENGIELMKLTTEVVKENRKATINNGDISKIVLRRNKQKYTDYMSDTEKQIEEKNITLHDASQMGDSSLMFSILLNGADVNEKDELGNTPLHYASTKLVASMLIGRGADIYAKNNAGIDVCSIERPFDPDNEVSKYILVIREKRKDSGMEQ